MNHPTKDFPFYNGTPVALTATQWALLMLSVPVGFAALVVPLGESAWMLSLAVVLFPAIPLLTLRAIVGPHWRALFHRLGWKDIRLVLGIVVLNLAVTGLMGVLVGNLFGANANPVFGAMAKDSTEDLFLFALRTIPQLLGEEVFTVLSLLGLLAFFSGGA